MRLYEKNKLNETLKKKKNGMFLSHIQVNNIFQIFLKVVT